MLKKVFKYDFWSIGRIWWIIALSVLGITLISSLSMRMVTEELLFDHPFLILIIAMLFIFSILAIVASLVITEILVFWRFYKNFFTDEGYLTFTLPVSRKTLLFSKLLTAIVWNIISFALIGICIFIMVAVIPPQGVIDFSEIFSEFPNLFTSEYLQISPVWIVVYFFIFLLILIASSILTVSLVFLCITLGSIIAKKMKLLAGIGFYYGFNMVISSVSQTLSLIFMSTVSSGIEEYLIKASPDMISAIIAIAFFIFFLIILALGLTVYFITLNCLERKLNLP